MAVTYPVAGDTAATLASIKSLCDAVNDLLLRLTTAEGSLSTAQKAIGAEVTARQQADTAEANASQAGDAAEGQARAAGLAAEATARDDAIAAAVKAVADALNAARDALRQALDDETSARTSADRDERQARIDAVNALATALDKAVLRLQAAIDAKAGSADLAAAGDAQAKALAGEVDARTRALADALAGVKATTDAIAATVAAQRLDFVAMPGRPGDAPTRYTFVSTAAALAGPRAALPLLLPALLANGDSGPVARVSGSGILALRAPVAIEPGRLYRVRYVVQRRANPADPRGDTVRCGIVYLDQSLRAIGDVVTVRDFPALVTANGRQSYEALVSRAQSADGPIAAPPAARFLVPVVQFFGPDHFTDVEVLDADDATDAYLVPAATADLAAQVAALVAGNFDARLQAVEQAAGTAGTVQFKSKGDARYGTIPDSVQVVTLLGRQFEGDGGGGRYVRTAAQVPDGADSFTSHGAVFLRETVSPDVVAGMLESGFEAWVAGLPTEPPPGSGKRWNDHGRPTVTP